MIDTDEDGLSDGEEVELGTNPLVVDTDEDGFSDFLESRRTLTNPLSKNRLKNINFGFESTFFFVNDKDGQYNWQNALEDAETRGGRLAVLDTQEKIDAAIQAMGISESSAWIGLTDEAEEGEWKWITGDPLEIDNWGDGEPNNSGGSEDYVEMRNWIGGSWNDERGSRSRWYILEIIGSTARESLFESNANDEVVVDAAEGFQDASGYLYQWYFNDGLMPNSEGGSGATYPINGVP